MNGRRPQGFWQRTVWFLIYPARKRHRAEATASGVVLITVSVGIGLAAYNAANNILFITLALLLSSLLLSGLLSWVNLRSVRVSLHAFRSSKALESSLVELRVQNGRRFLPALGLWFEMKAEPETALPVPAELKRQRRKGFGQRLALAEALVVQGRLPVRESLPPGGELSLEWTWVSPRRGPWLVQVSGIGSLFPFGFLRKFMHVGLEQRVIVRPADILYQLVDDAGLRGMAGAASMRVRGEGADLLSLRRYRAGDSHRMVHWKASARLGHLIVRETEAERGAAYLLRMETFDDVWLEDDHFETGVRLAARLAADLFTAGHLKGLWLGDAAPVAVRRAGDVEAWLDNLSCAARVRRGVPAGGVPQLGNLLEIKPEGRNGAAAYANGRQIAIA